MKNEIKTSIEIDATIDSFLLLVKSGIEMWSKAGQVLVKLVEKNPNVYSEIIKANTFVTFEMLLTFEKMGRRQIYPPLLMDASPGARLLLEYPYEIQEQLFSGTIDVAVERNGGFVVEKKYLKELSKREARAILSNGHVADIEKQKAYANQHPAPGRKKKSATPKSLGLFVVKLSPSGAIVLEKTDTKTTAQKIFMFKKDGTNQAVIELVEK